MKKKVKLYNIIFPIFMLYVFPTVVWVAIIALNFIIDSIVVILAAKARKLDWKSVWKSSILRVLWIGFLSDFIGGGLVCLLYFATPLQNLISPYTWPELLWITPPGIIAAGVLIYFLNKRFSFKKAGLEPAHIHHISLMLAIFTAPYTMMLPIYAG